MSEQSQARSVWKYSIPLKDQFSQEMPERAVPLTVQMQRGDPYLWVQVELGARMETRHFAVVGTGHQRPMKGWLYIGTFQLHGGALVFHLFETFGRE